MPRQWPASATSKHLEPPIGEASDAAGVEAKLKALAEQFELLKSQVRQAQQLAGLGTAAATMAHEVNNLLTPILSYVEFARSSDDPQLIQKALAVTAKNTRILVRMSERILEISSAAPVSRGVIGLRRVIDDAIESLCRDLGKDGIETTIDVSDSVTVRGDHLQLQQVVFNLLLNAREAMADRHGGRLTLAASRRGDQVRLTIHNTGPEIPAGELPHVFDLLHSTKPSAAAGRKRCSGLGLALCKELVEENGGSITAESDQANGTTFTLRLPAPGDRP